MAGRDNIPWLLRRVARQLRHFDVLALDPSPVEGLVSIEELTADLRVERSRRFMERYTENELRARLERAGALGRLRERGVDPVLALQKDEAGRHVLRITDGEDGPVVAEIVARFARLRPRGDTPLPGAASLDVVVLDWLLLQDPRASFSEACPRLPGQDHPGLGAGRETMRLLDGLARVLGREGILAFPSHYHNAVLAADTFRFIDPEREGELVALRRDLADLSLVEAAWAIEEGLVRDGTLRPYRWSSEEMGHPISQRFHAYFSSDAYAQRVKRAADERRFEVDAEAAREVARTRMGDFRP